MSNKAKTTTPKPDGKPALTPKLRFPEFRDAEGWKETKLKKIARPISDRAATGDGDNVLSLSGEHGLVLQSDYFGKKVAGDSAERYLKLVRNDFVYNDRTTKASVYGTIKRLSKYDGGIVSPIYKCFRFDGGEIPEFWECYFEAGAHESQLGGLVNEGARAGRFNISISQFLFTSAWRPKFPEQQKIAECLSSVDELIATQARKLNTLKIHKKGLMQQLFPREGETQPRLRFPEFQNAGEWKEKSFGKVLKITSGKGFKASEYSKAGIRLLQIENVGYGVTKWNENTIYLPETYAAEYPELVLRGGDIILALNRPVTNGELKIAKIQKHEAIAILYQRVGRLEVLNGSLQVDFAFQLCRQFIKDFVITKSIGSDQPFISLMDLYAQNVLLPLPAEQQRIADCLTTLDDLIAAQTQKLDALKTHKKGLMQQLFPSPEEVEA